MKSCVSTTPCCPKPAVKVGDIAISKTSGAIFLIHYVGNANHGQFAATVLHGKSKSGHDAGKYSLFEGFSELELYDGKVELSN
jgi:hypothetical protein